jgi:lysophospholipase L1-like esterase
MKNSKLILVVLWAMAAASFAFADILVKDGDKVAFLGDSITEMGNREPAGYVQLVKDGLLRSGVKMEVVPAGVPGDTSAKMLARLEKSVLFHKPTWMFLSCGVNDAMTPASIEDFKRNITEIIDKAQAAGIKVLVMSTTVRNEDLNSVANKNIEPFNQFLRELIRDRKLPFADNDAQMRSELKRRAGEKGLQLTIDGVHMNGYGNQIMAASILESLGVGTEAIKGYRKDWNKLDSMPAGFNNYVDFFMSIDEYEMLVEQAKKENTTAKDLLIQQMKKYVASLGTHAKGP